MFRVTRRRLAAISLFVAGALMTTACAGEVGAAAVVDGKRIEVSTVQDALQDLDEITDGLTQTDILGLLIVEPIWVGLGAERGVGFTDQEVETMLGSVVAEAGLENREFSQGAIDVLRTDLVISSLLNGPDGQEVVSEIQERVEAADIESNPRFGEFTADRGLNPVARTWIVDSPPNP